MSYNVLLGDDARDYLTALDDKSTRICKDNLRKLADDPYPSSGRGDKEKLVIDGHEQYRLHIGRTHRFLHDSRGRWNGSCPRDHGHRRRAQTIRPLKKNF